MGAEVVADLGKWAAKIASKANNPDTAKESNNNADNDAATKERSKSNKKIKVVSPPNMDKVKEKADLLSSLSMAKGRGG